MRKAIIIVAFAVTACLLQGCDFFRVLAGRPTSREIEEKRKAILLLDAVLPQNQADTVQVDALTEPAVDTPAETLPATEPAKEPATNQEVKHSVTAVDDALGFLHQSFDDGELFLDALVVDEFDTKTLWYHR